MKILLGILAAAMLQSGSFLTPLQQRDSVLIADQLRYGFRIAGVEEGTRLNLPQWQETGFCDGVELLSEWKLDTLKVNKAGKKGPASYDIEGAVTITSFEEGTYELPKIALQRWHKDGVVDTLSFESQFLTVTTIPLDTATFVVHDIKGQIRYPVTFGEIAPWLAGGIALIALAVLAIWLARKYLRKRREAELHREPAHIVALRKLDHYRGDKYWAADKQKQFYSGVTDALREYVVARYGVAAMEMTTAEIFAGLKDKDIPQDLYDELKALFERADFVKFAKFVVDKDDNAGVVPSAVRFVTMTYQKEIEAESGKDADSEEKK